MGIETGSQMYREDGRMDENGCMDGWTDTVCVFVKEKCMKIRY
jgi:hypothetical protein